MKLKILFIGISSMILLCFFCTNCAETPPKGHPIIKKMATLSGECMAFLGDNREQAFSSELKRRLEETIDQCEGQLEELNSPPEALYYLGELYFLLANHQAVIKETRKAIDSYQKSLALCRKLPTNIQDIQAVIGDICNALHLVYLSDGDKLSAEKYCLEAIEHYKESGILSKIGMARSNLIKLLMHDGNHEEARIEIEKSLSAYQAKSVILDHSDSTFFVNLLSSKSILFSILAKKAHLNEQYEDANKYMDISISTFKKIINKKDYFVGNELHFQWPVMLQTILFEWLDSPIKAYESEMGILFKEVATGFDGFKREGGLSRLGLHDIIKGEWLLMQNNETEGASLIRKGMEERLNFQINSNWQIINQNHPITYLPKSLLSYTRSLDYLLKGRDLSIRLAAEMSVIKEIQRKRLRTSDTRLTSMNNSHQVIFSSALKTAFEMYIPTSDQALLDTVNYLSEHLKSGYLNANIHRQKLAEQATGNVKKWLEEDDRFTYRMTQLNGLKEAALSNNKKDSLQHLFDQELTQRGVFRSSLLEQGQQGSRFYQELIQPTIPSIQDLQESMHSNQALIQFVDVQDHLLVMCVTQNTTKLIKTSPLKEWEDALKIYKLALQEDQGTEEFRGASHRIYKVCLADILNNLPPNITRLTIIRDGVLRDVSIEALVVFDNQAKTYENIPYLFKNYEIHYEYLLTSFFDNQIKTRDDRKNSLLICAPKYEIDTTDACNPSNGLPALYDLANRLGNLPNNHFLPNTKAALKIEIKDANNVFFAAHGIADSRNPLASYLLLNAGDNEQDCRLSLGEILSFDLENADVILGSCSTEEGRHLIGVGITSIAQAFRISGAISIIANLNMVNEKSTAEQLNLYFQYLGQGMSKSKALQQVKSNYLKNPENSRFSAPNYWANMILLGHAGEPYSMLN